MNAVAESFQQPDPQDFFSIFTPQTTHQSSAMTPATDMMILTNDPTQILPPLLQMIPYRTKLQAITEKR